MEGILYKMSRVCYFVYIHCNEIFLKLFHSFLGDRSSNGYGMDSVLNYNQNADEVRDFMPPVATGYTSMSGGTVMGDSIGRSLTESHSTRPSQYAPSFSFDDYQRSTLGSGYHSISSGSVTNASLNGIPSSSNSTSYGYLTESLTARNSTLTSLPDYDRRDEHEGYRTNQLSRERQEYLPITTYDATRASSMGLSVSPSLSGGPISIGGGSSSRLSDTIAVTNV